MMARRTAPGERRRLKTPPQPPQWPRPRVGSSGFYARKASCQSGWSTSSSRQRPTRCWSRKKSLPTIPVGGAGKRRSLRQSSKEAKSAASEKHGGFKNTEPYAEMGSWDTAKCRAWCTEHVLHHGAGAGAGRCRTASGWWRLHPRVLHPRGNSAAWRTPLTSAALALA